MFDEYKWWGRTHSGLKSEEVIYIFRISALNHAPSPDLDLALIIH